jgi:predicted secreted hydrolase
MPVLLAIAACGPDTQPAGSPPGRGDLSLAELLESIEGEFTPVGEMPTLDFPRDYAAHPAYRTEAWVLTGLVAGDSRSNTAVQLTIMRVGLGDAPDIESDWATDEVYAAVAMLADGSGDGVQVAERVSRAAAGLAGTSHEPPSIWVEDWRLEPAMPQPGTIELHGRIEVDGVPLEFDVASVVPMITPADIGGEDAAAAGPFAWYTQPKLDGSATFGDAGNRASAGFVLEHAWGELPLPGSPVARDRFTLFLDDGSQLMLVRSHRAYGGGTPETQGLFVSSSGDAQPLDADAIELEAADYWQSPRTASRYPVEWRLRIPSLDIDARLEPQTRASEGVAWAPFWMGPVDLVSSSSKVSGAGTMTLNGYEAGAN